MPEMHLKQPGFTYRACGPFTNKEFKNLKKRDKSCLYKNKLDKACFQHDMVYGDFKDVKRRTASDKISRDKTFSIAKNLLWFINFLIKSPLHLQINLWQVVVLLILIMIIIIIIIIINDINNDIKQNRCPLDLAVPQLAEELH